MADLDLKGKDLKDFKEGDEPRTKVIEVIVRQLFDTGHTINLAAKVAEDDGTTTDHTVVSTNAGQVLRFELAHLQEAVIRAKVVTVVQMDYDQSAVVAVPPIEEPPLPASKKQQPHEGSTHKSASHTAAR